MLTLAFIGLVGGLITGVSPCVLPMLPIIFFAGTAGKTVLATTARGEGDVLVLGPIFPALGHWIENPFNRLPKINRNNSSSDRGSGGSVRSAR